MPNPHYHHDLDWKPDMTMTTERLMKLWDALTPDQRKEAITYKLVFGSYYLHVRLGGEIEVISPMRVKVVPDGTHEVKGK